MAFTPLLYRYRRVKDSLWDSQFRLKGAGQGG